MSQPRRAGSGGAADFNELLIENARPPLPSASRDRRTGFGLFPGDIAVVNRVKSTVDGSIIIALVDGEFTRSASAVASAASGCTLRTPPIPTSRSAKD